jgi:hypothetical protein
VPVVGAYADEVALVPTTYIDSNCLNMEAIGAKPSPTSGRVSMEILSGGLLSKMKLRNVCPTGPAIK